MQQQAGYDVQWKQTVDDINLLIALHGRQTSDSERYQDITKVHWQSAADVKQCSNSTCRKSFGLFERPRNCRRCGILFCKQCTSYERRLNNSANFDSEGRLHKVCQKCFDSDPQLLGQTRDHYCSLFVQVRRMKKVGGSGSCIKNGASLSKFMHHDSLDYERECSRLCSGFEASVQSLDVGQALSDLFGVSKPDWEKSSGLIYGNMASRCYVCQVEIGLVQRRHNCTICGALVCTQCSSSDMIVYIPDETDAVSRSSMQSAKLAIIKVIGCPEKEPVRCRYLRVCDSCNHYVQERQVADYMAVQRQISHPVDDVISTWSSITDITDRLRNLQIKIDDNLPKYQDLIETLDGGTTRCASTTKHKSNMQVLAKSQSDLSDYFTKFVTAVISVKPLKPVTSGQIKILKHIIMSKVCYYQENMALFRHLQRQLKMVIPAESLAAIQAIVNYNAINSCYISVRQLIYELFDLTDRYHLEEALKVLLETLKMLLLNAEEDLQSCLTDSWEEHERNINSLLKEQLKKRRLIRRLFASQNPDMIQSLIICRVQTLLEQILLQLVAKACDSHFEKTKECLRKVTAELQIYRHEGDWVLIH